MFLFEFRERGAAAGGRGWQTGRRADVDVEDQDYHEQTHNEFRELEAVYVGVTTIW